MIEDGGSTRREALAHVIETEATAERDIDGHPLQWRILLRPPCSITATVERC